MHMYYKNWRVTRHAGNIWCTKMSDQPAKIKLKQIKGKKCKFWKLKITKFLNGDRCGSKQLAKGGKSVFKSEEGCLVVVLLRGLHHFTSRSYWNNSIWILACYWCGDFQDSFFNHLSSRYPLGQLMHAD